jgi:ubiquinone/menaquinone biosynthesis C-methylase UbiE
MSTVEQAWCRSLPWRAFTRRVVFPWAIGDADLHGDVLELGSGSGAMAVELLDRYPSIRLTATDVDPAMRAAATHRLARYGDRVNVQAADATSLPFEDASFDAVVSFIMLHHVIDWERALAEIARVLRSGGILAGYDLVESPASRRTRRLDRSPRRMATIEDIRIRLDDLPFDDVSVVPAVGRLVTRFRARRSTAPPLRR